MRFVTLLLTDLMPLEAILSGLTLSAACTLPRFESYSRVPWWSTRSW